MTAYDSDNIFKKIIDGELPAVKIFENETCIAIMDVFPQSQGHCLVIPRAESRNLLDADPDTLSATVPYVQRLAKATKAALEADGVRVAQFNEATAGQTVYHLHWHVIPTYEGVQLGRHGEGMADTTELQSVADKIATFL